MSSIEWLLDHLAKAKTAEEVLIEIEAEERFGLYGGDASPEQE